MEDELSAYVAKQDRVSASCRLTLLEEAELLDLTASGDFGGGSNGGNNQSRWWSNVDNVALYNRRNLIKAALEGTERPVTVAYPAGGGNAASSASYALTTGSSNSSGGAGGSGSISSSAVGTGKSKLAMFDSIKDDTIVTIANGGDKSITSFSSRFHSLGYTRPDEQVGAQAISYLNKALDHGALWCSARFCYRRYALAACFFFLFAPTCLLFLPGIGVAMAVETGRILCFLSITSICTSAPHIHVNFQREFLFPLQHIRSQVARQQRLFGLSLFLRAPHRHLALSHLDRRQAFPPRVAARAVLADFGLAAPVGAHERAAGGFRRLRALAPHAQVQRRPEVQDAGQHGRDQEALESRRGTIQQGEDFSGGREEVDCV